MAKKIIILERVNEPSDYSFKYVFWLDVPLTRQTMYANPDAVSMYKDATVAEIDTIRNGTIYEFSGEAFYPVGTSLSVITSDLIAKFNREQIRINNTNPWVKYGTYWDGSIWTNKEVG